MPARGSSPSYLASMPPETADTTEHVVITAVRGALAGHRQPVILAVSGGLDSIVLLDAAAKVAHERIAAVATFDHGTGPAARQAVALVQREGDVRRIQVVVGRATHLRRSEAAWRAARWSFLTQAARERGADVVTAHTADDQVETVCMRALRGAGARGLAGLYADSSVIRPLLGLHRADVAAYAAMVGLHHVEDPGNGSPAHLRNRLRNDLLPAIARTTPAFATGMLALARDAAAVRRQLDGIADRISVLAGRGAVSVPLAGMDGIAADGVAALAPALAERAGIVLDRRGTTRLTQFILKSRVGSRIQLSGGGEAVRMDGNVVIRRSTPALWNDQEFPLVPSVVAGAWMFRQVVRSGAGDAWSAALPADCVLTVREWRAGDRMRAAGSPAARRVKRFFSDAGIAGPERIGWPVVLADGEIVWIPGVRRSAAATDRSGRPVLRYRCERNDV